MDRCPDCSFDATEWNEQDATRTLAHVDEYIELWQRGSPTSLMAEVSDHADRIRDAVDNASAVDEAIHALWHGLVAIANARRDGGDGIPAQRGVVEQINVSGGGVPKAAVPVAAVGRRGLTGDRQRTRMHHGRPCQAVCLWSADVIESLQAEGHTVSPGAAGENLTLRGIDWSTLRAGLMVDLGSVTARLTSPATPCSKIADNFVDRDQNRVDDDQHPGFSRWYASVVTPGSVAVGDRCIVDAR